jgi:hypothetical protein
MNKFIDIARNQMECHQKQVSGVWSINAEDFCKKAGVSYQDAADYQVDMEMTDNADYVEEQLAHYEKALGPLTEEQEDHFRVSEFTSEINDIGYSSYFWANVVEQLEAK